MAEVIGTLQEALGPEIVLVGEAVPERNRDDWSGLPPTRPMIAGLSAQQVASAASRIMFRPGCAPRAASR